MNVAVARVTIQEGKEEEALAELQKMADAVQAQEQGALAYAVHRSLNNPSEILFFEMYADDAASQSHAQSAHMGEFSRVFAELFDAAKTKIERFERIGGFIRSEAN